MIRALGVVLAAIEFVAPHFQPRRAAAEELVELGRRHAVDPLTAVAVVENESHWNPNARGSAGEIGLGQVKPVCPNREPGTLEHENCVGARRESLYDWRTNLGATTGAFSAWREHCRARVGTALAVYWLQGYQGFDATRGTTCGHRRVGKRWIPAPVPELTRKILARRAELARRFGG